MSLQVQRLELERDALSNERDSLKSVIQSLECTLGSSGKQLTDLRMEHDRLMAAHRVRYGFFEPAQPFSR